HPRGGRLAVAAGDRHDRDARRGGGREEHVDDRLGDVLRLALGRMGVHPEAGCCVDLHDPAPNLADRLADVGAQEVDAGDVQAHYPGRQLGDLSVLRVDLLRAVDADAASAHVAGALQVDPLPAWGNVGHAEALLAQVGGRLGVDLD